MGIHSEAKLNRKFMEFAKLMNVYLNHFPKHEKFALANRIRSTAYEVYDLISEGQKRYIYKFRKSVNKEHQESVVSLLGHAKQTNSLGYMLKIIKEEIRNGKNLRIPKSYGRIYDALPAGA
jgi:hypothetical protein